MNFGAHICVADRFSGLETLDLHDPALDPALDPGLVGLGAALPDFAAIGRFRLRRPSGLAEVDAGVALHYRTDEVFHGHERFTTWQRRVAASLEATELSRGASRAVAHIGPELLIDGVLLQRADNRAAIGRAITSIGGVIDQLQPMVNAPDDAPWVGHLGDITSWPTPTTLGDSRFVAGRMQRILSRRPRLAFADSAIPAVAEALDTVTADISRDAEQLTTDIARLLRV